LLLRRLTCLLNSWVVVRHPVMLPIKLSKLRIGTTKGRGVVVAWSKCRRGTYRFFLRSLRDCLNLEEVVLMANRSLVLQLLLELSLILLS